MVGTTKQELAVGRPPKRVVLVMEIGCSFAGLVEKKEGDFERRS